jgi:uncharacterized protein (TIGR02594 family)
MTISEIQAALKTLGFDPGPIDGDAGPHTISAVTAFQRARGLVPDGIAGPLTQAALKRAIAAGGKEPPLHASPDQPGWLTLAYDDLGMKEAPGKANNPRVIAMFKDAGFPGIKTDSVAWCAASVGAWLQRAGHKPSGSLAARSYEHWGVGLIKPALGAIATKKRSSWQGHVFLVVGANKDTIFGLGGNQNDAVTIASFKRSEITSYRWPADVPIPTDWSLPKTIAGAKAGARES